MDQPRYCAVRVFIAELLSGELVTEPEQGIFLYTTSGEKINRVNVMGAVLHKETVGTITNLLVDDGTGKILVRFFEESVVLQNIMAGAPILIVGKVREYNGERYLSPEIIRQVSALWFKARLLELLPRKNFSETAPRKNVEPKEKPTELILEVVNKPILPKEFLNKKGSEKNVDEQEEIEVEEVGEIVSEGLPFQRIASLVKELDSGNGVLIEEIIEKSPVKETEQLLQKMLEKGEIFQITPGKVKVL